MIMHPRPSPALALRAFIAYCEGGQAPSNPFALLPYAETVALGIPFSETFIHEGIEWAVWVAGDCSPCELIALEKAGVVDAQ